MFHNVNFYDVQNVRGTLRAIKAGTWSAGSSQPSGSSQPALLLREEEEEEEEEEEARDVKQKRSPIATRCLGFNVVLWRTNWDSVGLQFDAVRQLFKDIAHAIQRRGGRHDDHIGEDMLANVKYIASTFAAIPAIDVFESTIEGLLARGYFDVARLYIHGELKCLNHRSKSGGDPGACEYCQNFRLLVPINAQSVERICRAAIGAAQKTVDECASLSACEEACQLAGSCLGILPTVENFLSDDMQATIQTEQNFVAAIKTLARHRLKVYQSARQVRECTKRIQVIQEVLESDDFTYSDVDRVKHLAGLLGMGSGNEQLQIQLAVAQHAFEVGDAETAAQQCEILTNTKCEGVWSLCHTLGKFLLSAEKSRWPTATKLLAFAVQKCPSDALPKVLADWKMCEETMSSQQRDISLTAGAQVANQATQLAAKTMGLGVRMGMQQIRLLQHRLGLPANDAAAQNDDGTDSGAADDNSSLYAVHPFYATTIAEGRNIHDPPILVSAIIHVSVDS